MKRKLSFAGLVIAIILLCHDSVQAQGRFEITPFGGYMFGGKMRFYEGDFKIQDNATYGILLDAEIAPGTKIELFWSQMNTTAEFRAGFGYEDLRIDPFDINVGYIQVGSLREIDYDNIKPFGIITLGTTYFSPQGTRYDQTWKFSTTLGGGAKIFFTDRIGIRLQGRLMLPMFWGGAGLSVGSGGAGFTVGAGTSMVQGDFSAGLIFAFGD